MFSYKLLLLLPLAIAQSWDWENNGVDWTGVCKTGTRQSPIDIQEYNEVDDGSLEFKISSSSKETGSQQLYIFKFLATADGEPYGYLTKKQEGQADQQFTLSRLHFHQPSEHRINGKAYDLEMHMIAHNTDENLSNAVTLAVLFDSSDDDENDFLEDIIDIYDDNKTAKINPEDAFDGITTIGEFYYYLGSDTVPDCAENQEWVIWKDIQDMSEDQLKWFKQYVSEYGEGGNVRVVQPLYGRTVTFYNGEDDWASYIGIGLVTLLGLF